MCEDKKYKTMKKMNAKVKEHEENKKKKAGLILSQHFILFVHL